jgi:hypothetical protein
MKLSEHFTFDELTVTDKTALQEINRAQANSKLSSLNRVAQELLEPVRVGLGLPITVTSGFRGPTLNGLIGGSKTSQHMVGEAVDFNVKDRTDREGQISVVKWMLENFLKGNYKFGQLLLERGCIHASLGTKCEVAEYDVPTKTKRPIPELA